ncbi:hypothetical protein [Cupriavidus metallidurans]|uniref:hypothetical protein n=1 Tax=Cupriavidus metallidurans TaxID=119219 RepID=UPI0004935624|nr:hypothetical protein [Cupriavidus metallidurans]
MGRNVRNAVAKPKQGVSPWASLIRPLWLDQVEAQRVAEGESRAREQGRRAYAEKRVSGSLFPGDL